MLVHSPFVGPAAWYATAQAFTATHRRARVPSLLHVARSVPPYWPAAVRTVTEHAADDEVLLVPHSNAGLFVPAIVDALGEQVRGVVFVDATLPGSADPPRDLLRALAVDGLLPPWTSWWDEAEVAELFSDTTVRAAIEAEQPHMPLAYFDHPPPAPDGWSAGMSCAYLWFGPPYDGEAAEAAARGWPTQHLPGTHLHMLADPAGVAAAVLRLSGESG